MKLPTSKDEVLDFIKVKKTLDEKILNIGAMLSPRLCDNLVEWKIEGDCVLIETDDYWSDGTHDFESASFPIKYLFMPENEVALEIKEYCRKKKLAEEAYKKEEKEKALKEAEEKEKAEYERLKAKFEL